MIFKMAFASIATFVCIITYATIVVGTLELNASVHDMILPLIEMQHEICSYVSLCKRSNSSTYEKLRESWFQCCSQCSCENDCMENGTCCPDFHGNFKEGIDDTMSNKYIKTLQHQHKCVQVNYGFINSNDGYKMITDCPRNYTNLTTKRHCASNFDTSVGGNELDNVPIYDQRSGISYKNRNCYLCNNDLVGNIQFWDIEFVCAGPFSFFSSEISGPIYVVDKLQNKFCNVKIHIAQRDANNVHTKPEECVSDSHIRSCKPDYAGTILEYLCSKYTWPLTVNLRVYKNYACVLCNDVSFRETCFTPGMDMVYKGYIKISDFGVLQSSTNQDTSSSINKLFPDSLENVCPKGFVFDKRRNECYKVACPVGFYVKDGDCLPYFEDLTGIAYTSIVEIVLPNTLYGTDTYSVERTIIAAINQTLRRCIGEGNYVFRLLSNSRTSVVVDSNRKYYIHFDIINQDTFYALPKFLYKFVVLEGLMKIKFGGNIDREVIVRLHFPFAFFIRGYEAFNSRGKKLYSVENRPLKETLFNMKQRVLPVGKSVLCYRAGLNSSDFKYVGRKTILVLETNTLLSRTNFHLDRSNKLFVCLEDAFGGRPVYMFGDTEIDAKVRTTKLKEIHTSDKVLTNTAEDHNEMLSKSLTAIACSVALLVCVFGIRKLSHFLLRCKANQDENVNHDTL